MRSVLKALVPPALRASLRESLGRRTHRRSSYSQEGEDLVLMRLFDDQPTGVYVDVGAHHPFRFSNTCLLHERGWRGINIDAQPGSMAPFRRFRPHDVNLEMGISEHPATLEFYRFVEPALNTFDRALAESRQAEGWPLADRRQVDCLGLAEVLQRELPRLGASAPDLLSVDVEGYDLSVLRSNDWIRYRPKAVVVEVLADATQEDSAAAIPAFLRAQGYRQLSRLYNSAVFVRAD